MRTRTASTIAPPHDGTVTVPPIAVDEDPATRPRDGCR